MPVVPVFAEKYVESWEGGEVPEGMEGAELVASPWGVEWDTDAHAVGYVVRGMGEGECMPRLGESAAAFLRQVGEPVEQHWLFLDVDTEPHVPWFSEAQARQAVHDVLAVAYAQGLMLGAYTTRAGLRLYAPLVAPIDVRYTWDLITQVMQALAPGMPSTLKLDEHSREWTRLMRLPHVTRDGELHRAYLVPPIAPLDAGRWDLQLREVEPRRSTAHLPDAPVDLSWEDLQHVVDMPWAGIHEVPPGATGSRYEVIRSALAKVAARGRYEDPHVLASFFWRSVELTLGSSLGLAELWDLAEWVADRQAQANAEAAKHHAPDAPPDYVPLTQEEWQLLRDETPAREVATLHKLRDGMRLTKRPGEYTERTWEVLRRMIERSQLPADVFYRAFYVSVQAQAEPTFGDLWLRCRDMCGTRLDSDSAIRQAFVRRFPLTVQPVGGQRLYQLDTSTTPYSYVRVTKDGLDLALHSYTRPTTLPFGVDYRNQSLANILRDYGALAHETVYVSGQQGTYYNPTTGQVTEGVHQLAQTVGAFDPVIDEWVRALGGDDVDTWLDWLACVADTSTTLLPAVVMEGAPGSGKTLMARGIASLWGTSPAEYEKCMLGDGFNSDMLRCPLLYADEGIKLGKRVDREQASQTFRTSMTTMSHRVRSLYQEPMVLQGALRVLVTNNPDEKDALPFGESLGRDGLEAIVHRIIYLSPTERAREILQSQNLDEVRATWAPPSSAPGRIAKYLTWLRHTRKVTQRQGTRFLVQGKETAWHRKFIIRQGDKPGVLQVLLELASRRARGLTKGDVRVRIQDGFVWTTPTTVVMYWQELSRMRHRTPGTIRTALDQLCTAERHIEFDPVTRRAAKGVPFQTFVDAGVCEIEDLEELGEK